jgi:two-component system, NarL family, sensor histidine kinase UhpB
VSVNVKLEAAQRLYRVAQDRGDAELEATRALVRETMGELRRSLADLRAPLPDHHDLPAALGRLAAEYSARGGLEVQLAAREGAPAQPELAETLFLIAREALSNVERHAGATHARLELARLEHGWLLRVADNGAGLRSGDLQRPGHFGVVGMRERASALGGTLRVEPRQGGGTVVEASLPTARVD